MSRQATDNTRKGRVWSIAAAVLFVIAIAQVDEHRRYERINSARAASLAGKERARQMILEQYAQTGSPPPATHELWRSASAPAAVGPLAPEHRRFVTRVRRAVGLGAFVIWMELLGVKLLGTRRFNRRHAPLIGHAMLAAALLGTGLMLLGNGYWRNWREAHPARDPPDGDLSRCLSA